MGILHQFIYSIQNDITMIFMLRGGHYNKYGLQKIGLF
jgi:hypothetical protein